MNYGFIKVQSILDFTKDTETYKSHLDTHVFTVKNALHFNEMDLQRIVYSKVNQDRSLAALPNRHPLNSSESFISAETLFTFRNLILLYIGLKPFYNNRLASIATMLYHIL